MSATAGGWVSLDAIEDDAFPAFPSVGYMGLSYLCNMKCAHCYALEQPRSRHLPFPDVVRIIDDLADLFCCTLVFGHGEPFLYPKFFEVLSHAKARGMNTVIMTNGSRITDEIASRLTDERCRPYRLYVSLDHLDATRHDQRRRVPGAFLDALAAIGRLRAVGLDARIASTIDLDDLQPASMWVDMCDRLGGIGLSLLTIRNKRIYSPASLNAYAALLRDLTALNLTRPDLAIMLHDPLVFRFVDTDGLNAGLLEKIWLENRCTAGSERIAIQPDGTVTTCNLVDGPVLGNVLEMSIRDIWENSPYLARMQARQQSDPVAGCETCHAWQACRGGCPAYSTSSELNLTRDGRCEVLAAPDISIDRGKHALCGGFAFT